MNVYARFRSIDKESGRWEDKEMKESGDNGERVPRNGEEKKCNNFFFFLLLG